VFPDVEDVGQGLEVGRLEDLFGFIAFERPGGHLQLGVQVGHDLTEELLQNFAQAFAQVGRVLLHAPEHAGAALHCHGQFVPQASFVAVPRVLLVLKTRCLVRADFLRSAELVVLVNHLARGVELGDQLVDLGRQTEQPVEIVLAGFLLAFRAGFFDALGEFVAILGYAQSQRQFPFVADVGAIDADADAERAVLVAIGFELRFIEDLVESRARQLVPLAGFRLEVASLFRFPVLFLGSLELPTLFRVANKLGSLQSLDGGLNFAEGLCFADFIDQYGGQIGLGAREVANELQKADGLGDPQRPTVDFGIVGESLTDLVDVGALLVREVPFHQLEDLVQRHQSADGLPGERSSIRHQHLVRLFDDGTVAAAVVAGSARLKANARHDPDAEIDVVRWVRIKMNEITLVDIGAPGCSFKPQSRVQLTLIVGEKFLQRLLGFGLLGQDALGGHFADVGWGKVDTVMESVLKFGDLDALGVDGGDHFIRLFLGCDDDPARRRDPVGLEQVLADLAELFDGRPQVFDLVAAAGDMLAHFVNDEDKGLALPPSPPELEGAFHDLADRDSRVPVALGV